MVIELFFEQFYEWYMDCPQGQYWYMHVRYHFLLGAMIGAD